MILQIFRLFIGLLIIFFLPGYLVLKLLYPRERGMSLPEEITLAVAVSVSISILLLAGLNILFNVKLTHSTTLSVYVSMIVMTSVLILIQRSMQKKKK